MLQYNLKITNKLYVMFIVKRWVKTLNLLSTVKTKIRGRNLVHSQSYNQVYLLLLHTELKCRKEIDIYNLGLSRNTLTLREGLSFINFNQLL